MDETAGTRVPIRVGVGENLFTQTDTAWEAFQPLVAPAFRKKALDMRLSEIDALVADEVSAIPDDVTIDLELALGRISLRVAAWVLLGEQLDATRRRRSRTTNARSSVGSVCNSARSPDSSPSRWADAHAS